MVIRSDGQILPPRLYREPDTAKHFPSVLQMKERKIKAVFANPKPMHMTKEHHKNHANATDCHVCNKAFNGDSPREHCHITGKYRGAPTTCAASSYVCVRRLQPYRWSSTTCGATTATSSCRQSQRLQGRPPVSLITQRNSSPLDRRS